MNCIGVKTWKWIKGLDTYMSLFIVVSLSTFKQKASDSVMIAISIWSQS